MDAAIINVIAVFLFSQIFFRTADGGIHKFERSQYKRREVATVDRGVCHGEEVVVPLFILLKQDRKPQCNRRMQCAREHVRGNEARHAPVAVIKRMNIAEQIVKHGDPDECGHRRVMQYEERRIHRMYDLGFRIDTAMDHLLRTRDNVHAFFAKEHTVREVLRIAAPNFFGEEGIE